MMLKAKKIGIFAGTFDPVHNGHLAFAHAALDCGLEKVMFLPEPRPRYKQGVRALEHRVKMMQLAIADKSQFGTIILEQARFTPPETLPRLQERFKGYGLVLLFGADVMRHIAHWPHIEELTQTTELLIACRHQERSELEATLQTLARTSDLHFNYRIIEPPHEQIASSVIRLHLKRGQQPEGLSPAVARYIQQHNLYSASADSK